MEIIELSGFSENYPRILENLGQLSGFTEDYPRIVGILGESGVPAATRAGVGCTITINIAIHAIRPYFFRLESA